MAYSKRESLGVPGTNGNVAICFAMLEAIF
jgi:hypothetical protein